MFSGALMRMGAELGILTPYNEYTYHMIKALEEKNDGRFDYTGNRGGHLGKITQTGSPPSLHRRDGGFVPFNREELVHVVHGVEPRPRSSMADRQPEMYSSARSTEVSRS